MLEIYFNDLNDEGKQKVLDYLGLETPEEVNMDVDIVPLAIIEISNNESE
jgi:hypothetical protein